MNKFFYIGIVSLTSLVQYSHAQDSESRYKLDQVIFGNSLSTTAKYFPKEMADFKTKVQGQNDFDASQLALDLIVKCKALLLHKRQSIWGPHDESSAYLDSWVNALRLYSVISDPKAKDLILTSWNEGLIDSPEVIEQVRALNNAEATAFFTTSFWKLFLQTKDNDLIGRMGYVIARKGTALDIAHVAERLSVENDSKIKDTLGTTLAYFKWVQGGSDKRNRPSSALPY